MTSPPDDLGVEHALLLRLQSDRDGLETLQDADRKRVLLLHPYFLALRRAADQAAAEDAPALADDPIALALGLVPGVGDVLSPARLKATRKHAALKLGGLAQALQARGWKVDTKTVFDWELNPSPVAPALINAVAAVFQVQPDALREPQVTAGDPDVVFRDPQVVHELERWSRHSGTPLPDLHRRLAATLSSAAARNRKVELDQGLVLKVLEVMRHLDEPSPQSG
jgi:hypothetical protein